MEISIRPATTEDATEIARLSGELGYPTSAQEMADRLGGLLQQGKFIAVAVQREPVLLGWIAAESRLSLESGRMAEITGLVVDSRAKRSGIGSRLVAAAEDWARSCGHDTVIVRSNAVRLESHPFYLERGYARAKTQHVYSKPLTA
jgi:GNAT superfamily N-acetyltransferase